MTRQHGFTLIELMIVVTIIGIIAAIAIPAYQNYLSRAKVAEGLTLAQPVKTAIASFHNEYGRFPADNAELSLGAPAALGGRYVRSTEVQADGVIVVTFSDPTLIGRQITLTPSEADAAVRWTCTTTLPSHLKPKECS